uniref:Uncharacterized protein n=1 Tax=Coptotermes formosanus TaxID=36987 RepID=R4UWS8_COPFO|nr:hypothetical protein [Coptotermes formosanus]
MGSTQKQSFINETPVVIWIIQFHIGQDTLYSVTWCTFIVWQTVELFVHWFEICLKNCEVLLPACEFHFSITADKFSYLLLLSASAFQQVSFPLFLKTYFYPFIS